jgi:peptide/nickel transport system permease protein
VMVGALLSSLVVVETVFAYPGLGRLIYEAVTARDYPLLQGGLLLITIGVIVLNLLADLTYPLLDPRVRRPAESAL